MTIGINLLPIRKNLTGVGVYAYNILLELAKQDKKNSYLLFTNRENDDIFSLKDQNFRSFMLPFRAENVIIRILYEQLVLPYLLKKNKVDVVYSPSVALPLFAMCKKITCIHDLIPFQINKKFSKFRSFYVKKITKMSAKTADKILTVSFNSKREIEKRFRIPSEKIVVTYNGVSKALMNINKKSWREFKGRHNIPEKYILFVGTLEPGKNINQLIKAFKILMDRYGYDHKLIIAGGKGWMFNSIYQEVEKNNLQKFVIFPGYVPMDALGLLYKNSDVFVLPSLSEGFGLPALEAMYFETPVVISHDLALLEVVGDAGEVVDPYDEFDIAQKLHTILADSGKRRSMIEKGKKQALKFSWEKAGRITQKYLKSYERE
jgi:glycosyltransferase involved in cell wall biosynthesis